MNFTKKMMLVLLSLIHVNLGGIGELIEHCVNLLILVDGKTVGLQKRVAEHPFVPPQANILVLGLEFAVQGIAHKFV